VGLSSDAQPAGGRRLLHPRSAVHCVGWNTSLRVYGPEQYASGVGDRPNVEGWWRLSGRARWACTDRASRARAPDYTCDGMRSA